MLPWSVAGPKVSLPACMAFPMRTASRRVSAGFLKACRKRVVPCFHAWKTPPSGTKSPERRGSWSLLQDPMTFQRMDEGFPIHRNSGES